MQVAEKRKIQTASFVHVGDRLVSTEDLNAEQKARVATWLKTTYLNELFKGKAEFREAPATAK